MPTLRWTMAAAAWFLIFSNSIAAEEPDPLFQSDAILDVRIVAPLTTILSKRPPDEEFPGSLHYADATDGQVQLDIEVKTRGRYRLRKDVCKFPPLRIDVQTSQAKGTLFHKQDKIKLVTHCQAMRRYEQSVLREYVAYRILNELTDASFRVRLLRVNYDDSERDNDSLVRYGFFIEHRDRLAKRLQVSVADIPETTISALDPGHTNLVSMYHYLIGNTDFSPIKGTAGERCCHNHVLFEAEDYPYRSVPYDFDQSGLVDARHATTSPRFKLRSVRHRLYRGRCANNSQLATTVAIFLEKRGDISGLVTANTLLSRTSKKQMSAFIDKFYKVLASDKRIAAEFTQACN